MNMVYSLAMKYWSYFFLTTGMLVAIGLCWWLLIDDNTLSYDECQKKGGAIHNLTNDCYIEGVPYKTSHSTQ